jgi:hypothetical protein
MRRTTWLRNRPRPKRPPGKVRLHIEQLETRNLMSTAGVLGPLVQVANVDPFAGNTADNVSGQVGTNFPNTQVEPSLAIEQQDSVQKVFPKSRSRFERRAGPNAYQRWAAELVNIGHHARSRPAGGEGQQNRDARQ